jgi:hypothetical protein
VKTHPQVALSIADPDNPYRYLEVRGAVEEIEPDPAAGCFMHPNNRNRVPFFKQGAGTQRAVASGNPPCI